MKTDDLTKIELQDKVLKAARKARANAYAPYSKFKVGAAVVCGSGNIYVGCNVENAAYPEGLCAEASAIAAMVAGGDKFIRDIYIVGTGDELVPPCGGCRQKIREFSTYHTVKTYIHICNDKGEKKTYLIEDLLPEAFGREYLETQT